MKIKWGLGFYLVQPADPWIPPRFNLLLQPGPEPQPALVLHAAVWTSGSAKTVHFGFGTGWSASEWMKMSEEFRLYHRSVFLLPWTLHINENTVPPIIFSSGVKVASHITENTANTAYCCPLPIPVTDRSG